MRRTIIAVLLLSMLTIAGCGSTNVANSNDATVERWALPPLVFVNNTYYQMFGNLPPDISELDEIWIYLGDIQSAVPGYKFPTENFQANHGRIGARIYHAYDGRIPVNVCEWGDALEEEVIGNSIIVVYEGQRYLYISEEARTEVMKILNSVERQSLLVDGVMYSLRATAFGGNFSINDSFTFLGEVESAVSLYELPTENLQANRKIFVGMRVYRLPPDGIDNIVVLNQWGTRHYFSALSG